MSTMTFTFALILIVTYIILSVFKDMFIAAFTINYAMHIQKEALEEMLADEPDFDEAMKNVPDLKIVHPSNR